MTLQDRDVLLDRCVEYHGHLCMGQALGVRLALKGMELIGTTNPREMIVFIENDRCIADAVQVVTGTRLGRRSAKLINYGKMAVVMVNTQTSVSFRVSVRSFAPKSGRGSESIRAVLDEEDANVLAWKRVRVVISPDELPGRPRRTVECSQCGERVFDGRDIASDHGPLCLACARGPYYEVVD